MSIKVMTPEEFQEWSEKPGRTLAEVEEMSITQQALLRDELLASSGNTLDEYQSAPRDGQQMMMEEGAQVWIDEDAEREASAVAADSAEQAEIQTQFITNHPQHFPSEVNGQIFLDAYVEAFREVHPKITHVFWDLPAMEAVYNGLVAAGAFEVERKFRE